MTTEASIFETRTEIPPEFYESARKKGWPDSLLDRACELRTPRGIIEFWVTHQRPQPEEIKRFLDMREQLMSGPMRVREATWNDAEAVADLYASSPEEIGDWEVTVDRSPYPFAQFRLQEHVAITVLEDRGIIFAATADSSRNAIVGGQRTSVHIASAWRVRKEFRGQGMSRLLRMGAGPACSWFGMYNYYYIRSQNFGALNWIKAFLKDAVDNAPEREGDVPGLPVTVHHLRARPFQGSSKGARPAQERDLPRCVQLINRTHKGQDLFRPYTEEFLRVRLDDPSWGEKPDFWVPVYGWPDYFVLEEDGRVVACAGLWDKGNHVRERWVHKETGERRLLESTALLDFGFAAGREEAMARLISFLVGRTQELERGFLVAPLEQLPKVARMLGRDHEVNTETRAMHFQKFDQEADNWAMSDLLTKVYTDLAYW